MSDAEGACDEVFLDGCGRPWGRTPKPQVEDPWNWIPEFGAPDGRIRYIRVRKGPRPPADMWPTAPPPYEARSPRTESDSISAPRAALGGRSSVTGAELPASLDACPAGARAARYAMALAAARHVDPTAAVPVPAGVSPEEAERVRRLVDDLLSGAPAPQ